MKKIVLFFSVITLSIYPFLLNAMKTTKEIKEIKEFEKSLTKLLNANRGGTHNKYLFKETDPKTLEAIWDVYPGGLFSKKYYRVSLTTDKLKKIIDYLKNNRNQSLQENLKTLFTLEDFKIYGTAIGGEKKLSLDKQNRNKQITKFEQLVKQFLNSISQMSKFTDVEILSVYLAKK